MVNCDENHIDFTFCSLCRKYFHTSRSWICGIFYREKGVSWHVCVISV